MVCFQPCCPWCPGKDDISLQRPLLSSTTTVVLKANAFSFLFLRWCFVCFFFSLQETFIHVKLYRNNFLFTALPKSLSVTKSHLYKAAGFMPINFLLQKSAGGWAETIPAETRAQPGAGSTVRPGCTPENAKCINTEWYFLILHSEIATGPKEWRERFPSKNKRQERDKWLRWGQRKQSSFLQHSKETSLFRAYAIENADSDRPENSQVYVRLVKAKGSPEDCLMGESLIKILLFIFKLTFLFETAFQKFTYNPLL